MPNIFSVKLKLLAGRFLGLQLYILRYFMEEGSGANAWMHKPKQILAQDIP